MKATDKIKTFMQQQEGYREHAYKPLPNDRPTIGFGNTYYSDGTAVCMGDVLDEESAKELFNSKVDNLAILLSTITNPSCTQNQFDAVLSLCYNIGFPVFKNSTTGGKYHNGQDISDRFAMWDRSGGVEIPGLLKRRLREKEIYDHSNYGN